MASSAKHLWDKQVVLLRWGSELSRAFPWLSTSQSGVRLSRLLERVSVLLYLQPKICSDWWIWMSGVVGVLAGVLQPLGSEAA